MGQQGVRSNLFLLGDVSRSTEATKTSAPVEAAL
jgi:hypothetical protein